jgi:hypothetical protein
VEFHAVSEHDVVQEPEPHHRPQRRRRAADASGSAGEPVQAPLELVETQGEAPAPAAEEEEPPRRTRPRRRRRESAAGENEPLQLVETRPGSSDSQPSP